MGNQLSAPPRFQPEHLQELQKVVFKQSLGGPTSSERGAELPGLHVTPACAAGGGRFLRTVQCIHDEAGLVVIKARSIPWVGTCMREPHVSAPRCTGLLQTRGEC